jgi:hypothetical protein
MFCDEPHLRCSSRYHSFAVDGLHELLYFITGEESLVTGKFYWMEHGWWSMSVLEQVCFTTFFYTWYLSAWLNFLAWEVSEATYLLPSHTIPPPRTNCCVECLFHKLRNVPLPSSSVLCATCPTHVQAPTSCLQTQLPRNRKFFAPPAPVTANTTFWCGNRSRRLNPSFWSAASWPGNFTTVFHGHWSWSVLLLLI